MPDFPRKKQQESHENETDAVKDLEGRLGVKLTPSPYTHIEFLTVGKGEKETVILVTENICRVLREDGKYKGCVRYDEFTGNLEVMLTPEKQWEPISDQVVLGIMADISIRYGVFTRVKKAMVDEALVIVGYENAVHSVRSFFEKLEWDGEGRLDSWLVASYGVEDTLYHQQIGSNWVKALVKRVVHPGSKFDNVLVLAGPQGWRKSTSLACLVGKDWHLETTAGVQNKDFLPQMEGKVVVEFSEGETLGHSTNRALKAFITIQVDKYRRPYDRYQTERPRQSVFAMTTNEGTILSDSTGNRRWWFVDLEREADTDWLEANREQLLAEAYERVIRRKETYWEVDEEAAKAKQESKRMVDINEEKIVEWYEGLTEDEQEEGVTFGECYDAVFRGKTYSHELGTYEPDKKEISKNLMWVFRDAFEGPLGLVHKQVRIGRGKEKKGWGSKREYRWVPRETR